MGLRRSLRRLGGWQTVIVGRWGLDSRRGVGEENMGVFLEDTIKNVTRKVERLGGTGDRISSCSDVWKGIENPALKKEKEVTT